MLIKEGETRDSWYYLPNMQPQTLSLFDYETNNSSNLTGSSQDLTDSSQDLKLKLEIQLASFGFKKMPGKMKSETIKQLILSLCEDSFIKLKDLSILLDRDQTFIQQHYLSKMILDNLLKLKYPNKKNHPDQAYQKTNHYTASS